MYEELIKRLRDIASHDSNIESNYIGLALLQAADAIEVLSKTEKTTQWIPVTERLPSYGDRVLGIGPKKGYHVCEYRGITHWPSGGDDPWFSAKGSAVTITHWMPLPEPPKEG